MRRALIVTMAVTVACLLPAVAFASTEDGRLQSANPLGAQALVSGVAGTCPWELDSSGVLTVHPGDYGKIDASGYENLVTKVVFKAEAGGRVVLGRGEDAGARLELDQFKNMTAVDVSGLDLSLVTDMSDMFEDCEALAELDVSAFDTSHVTSMSDMFSGCSSLTELDVSHFDTSHVTSMSYMFDDCEALAELDVSGFDTTNVKGMNSMFSGCSSLTELDLSGFNTSNVMGMRSMFEDCSSLISLDVSSFDTSNMTNMDFMFRGCLSLAALDLSSFDVSNVKDSSWKGWTFRNCNSLRKLVLPKGLNPESLNGTWRGPGGITIAGSDFSTKYVPATMYGTWDRVFDISQLRIEFDEEALSTPSYTGEELRPAVTVTEYGWLNDFELVEGVDYLVAYSDNVYPGTAKVEVTGIGHAFGSQTLTFTIATDRITMHRLYNPYSGEHFYTASDDERDGLSSLGWDAEGTGWVAPGVSKTPVYRLYNPYVGDHHYTLDAVERDGLVEAGWIDEGVGWYSDDEQRTPLYREYNPYMPSCNHNYTTDAAEHDNLVSIGWVDEGIAWYGV